MFLCDSQLKLEFQGLGGKRGDERGREGIEKPSTPPGLEQPWNSGQEADCIGQFLKPRVISENWAGSDETSRDLLEDLKRRATQEPSRRTLRSRRA